MKGKEFLTPFQLLNPFLDAPRLLGLLVLVGAQHLYLLLFGQEAPWHARAFRPAAIVSIHGFPSLLLDLLYYKPGLFKYIGYPIINRRRSHQVRKGTAKAQLGFL